jgi:alcohol dehydrogenase (cytochrome c)
VGVLRLVRIAPDKIKRTDGYKRFLAGEEIEIWPSRGTNAVPIAFDPNTGLVYASTWNVPRIQKLASNILFGSGYAGLGSL